MTTDDKLQLRIAGLGEKRFYTLMEKIAESDNIETAVEELLEDGTKPIDLLLVLARYCSVQREEIDCRTIDSGEIAYRMRSPEEIDAGLAALREEHRRAVELVRAVLESKGVKAVV